MPLTIAEQMHECLFAVHVARMHRNVWGTIMVRADEDWNDVVRIYPEFFATLINATFGHLIVLMYRFLEERDDVVSPLMLFRRMCHANLVPDAKKAELEKSVEDMRPLWEKAKTLRHKSIAHLEVQVSQNLIYRCEDFSPA
jgi:hypothetical protein